MSEETKDQGEIIVRREYYDELLAKAAERDEMMTKVYLYAQERDKVHEEIKALHVRITELVEQADAAYAPYRERVEAFRAERDSAVEALDKTRERLHDAEEVIAKVDNWARAYPLDVFPEPDIARCAELLNTGGQSIERLAAYARRGAIEWIGTDTAAYYAKWKDGER